MTALLQRLWQCSCLRALRQGGSYNTEWRHGRGAVNGKAIMAAADVFRKPRGLHEKCTLPQSMTQTACEQVLDAKSSEWCLTSKCLKEQPKLLAKRLRAACRRLSQAVMKGSKADWVLAVVGEAGARVEAKMADVVWYGWDAEQEVAWRSAEDRRSQEVTRQLQEPPGACEDDRMIAVWSDGEWATGGAGWQRWVCCRQVPRTGSCGKQATSGLPLSFLSSHRTTRTTL